METFALVRKFVVALGFGLVLASLPLDAVRTGNFASYSKDGTTYAFLIALVVVGAGFLLANVMLEGERFLGLVSATGAVLLGFFALIPLGYFPSHLGDLRYGSWFGLGGSLLIALGAAPSGLFGFSKKEARSGWAILGSRLAGVLGLGLVAVSLPLALTAGVVSDDLGHLHHPEFWNSGGLFYGSHGNHSLGIAMAVLAALAVACLVAASLLRARPFEGWAVAISVVLLGLASYEFVRLAFNHLVGVKPGAGLGLEGALLAVGATTTALLARRGVIKLNRSSLRQLVAIVGLGMALAADSWTEVFSTKAGNFWADGTAGGFPLILIVVGVALVAVSFAVKRWWILPAVSALGWVLLGFFVLNPAVVVPKSGNLGPATWLGVAGGAVIGLSSVSLRLFSDWQLRPFELTRLRVAAWLGAGAGLGLVVWSLWLDTERFVGNVHLSYWDVVGNSDHSLGILMLVLAVSALVALAGAVRTRIPLLAGWTLAASLTLVGIAVYQPAFEAFNHLGNFRAGTWLALVGSLLASAAATVILLQEPRESEEIEEAVASRPVSTRSKGRKTAKSRVPGTRAKR